MEYDDEFILSLEDEWKKLTKTYKRVRNLGGFYGSRYEKAVIEKKGTESKYNFDEFIEKLRKKE